jgi:hypothetical protein
MKKWILVLSDQRIVGINYNWIIFVKCFRIKPRLSDSLLHTMGQLIREMFGNKKMDEIL